MRKITIHSDNRTDATFSSNSLIFRINLSCLVTFLAINIGLAQGSTPNRPPKATSSGSRPIAEILPYLPDGYAVSYDFIEKDVSSAEDRKREFDYDEYVDTQTHSHRDNHWPLKQEEPVVGHVTLAKVDQKIYYAESRNYKKFSEVSFDAETKTGFIHDYVGNRVILISKLSPNDTIFIPFPTQDKLSPLDFHLNNIASIGLSLSGNKTIVTKVIDIAGSNVPVTFSAQTALKDTNIYTTLFTMHGEHGEMERWEFLNYGYQEGHWFPKTIIKHRSLALMPEDFPKVLENKKTLIGDYYRPGKEIRYEKIRLKPISTVNIPEVEDVLNANAEETAVQDSREGKTLVGFYYKPGSGSLVRQTEKAIFMQKEIKDKQVPSPGNQGYFLLVALPIAVLGWVIYRRYRAKAS